MAADSKLGGKEAFNRSCRVFGYFVGHRYNSRSTYMDGRRVVYDLECCTSAEIPQSFAGRNGVKRISSPPRTAFICLLCLHDTRGAPFRLGISAWVAGVVMVVALDFFM